MAMLPSRPAYSERSSDRSTDASPDYTSRPATARNDDLAQPRQVDEWQEIELNNLHANARIIVTAAPDLEAGRRAGSPARSKFCDPIVVTLALVTITTMSIIFLAFVATLIAKEVEKAKKGT
ncbi:hypothetical protein BR93DRAFT_927620 [Coniochaeta sp. PMI_546]|nr:hypothetical protein BR93DRAFT_927620 [Coniochaeta sp. PMI_546]